MKDRQMPQFFMPSSDTRQLKGVLVNAYGVYSEPMTDEMLQKLEIRK